MRIFYLVSSSNRTLSIPHLPCTPRATLGSLNKVDKRRRIVWWELWVEMKRKRGTANFLPRIALLQLVHTGSWRKKARIKLSAFRTFVFFVISTSSPSSAHKPRRVQWRVWAHADLLVQLARLFSCSRCPRKGICHSYVISLLFVGLWVLRVLLTKRLIMVCAAVCAACIDVCLLASFVYSPRVLSEIKSVPLAFVPGLSIVSA